MVNTNSLNRTVPQKIKLVMEKIQHKSYQWTKKHFSYQGKKYPIKEGKRVVLGKFNS